MGRKRNNTVNLASNERARIPFAIVGVLLLITSASVVGVMQSRTDAKTNIDTAMAMDQIQATAQSTLTDAVREATTKAAQEPITKTAQTPVGKAIGGTNTFERYVRLRIYLQAQKQLQNADQTVGEGARAGASLPDLDYSQSEIEAAIDGVKLTPGLADPDDDVEPGTVRVTFDQVNMEVVRDGDVIGSRSEPVTVTVASTVFALRKKTQEYEGQLQSGALDGAGFGKQFGARLYPIAYAKAYYERTGPKKTKARAFKSIIENYEVETLANHAIFGVQRDVYGTQDQHATETMAGSFLCMGAKTISKMSSSKYKKTPKNFCKAMNFLFDSTGSEPGSLKDLVPASVKNRVNKHQKMEIPVDKFTEPAAKDVRGQTIIWQTPDGKDRPENSDKLGDVGKHLPNAGSADLDTVIDRIYQARSWVADESMSKTGSMPSAPSKGGSWEKYDEDLYFEEKNSISVSKTTVASRHSGRQKPLHEITITLKNKYKNDKYYKKEIECEDSGGSDDGSGSGSDGGDSSSDKTCYERDSTHDSSTITYKYSFTIVGKHSTGATVDSNGVDHDYVAGGWPTEYRPNNFRDIPERSLQTVLGVKPGNVESGLKSKINPRDVDDASDLKSEVVDTSDGKFLLTPKNKGQLKTELREELADTRDLIEDEIGSIEVERHKMVTADNPFSELKDRLDNKRDAIVYEGDTGSYASAPDKARVELRKYYLNRVFWWMNKVNEKRSKATSKANSKLGGGMKSALKAGAGFLDSELPTLPDSQEAGTQESGLMGEIDFKIRGAPTYLSAAPVTRQTVPAVRPRTEGPSSPENTMHAPFASRNKNFIEHPGLPVIPWPSYWYASVNNWNVRVKGEYARWEVSARTDDPSSTKPTTLVREAKPVTLEINGMERRAGIVEPIKFESLTPVFILVPGATVMPSGTWGVGDRKEPGKKHKLIECTQTWDHVGPDFTPAKATPKNPSGVTNEGCGNHPKQKKMQNLVTNTVLEKTGSAPLTGVAGLLDDDDNSLCGDPEESDSVTSEELVDGDTEADERDQSTTDCKDNSLEVSFLDVNQGTSVLIEAPNGKNMLVDAGQYPSNLMPSLNKEGVDEIDKVVFTHNHSDHIGGFEGVHNQGYLDGDSTDGDGVTTIYTSGVDYDGRASTPGDIKDLLSGQGYDWEVVEEDDDLDMGNVDIEVLNPPEDGNREHPPADKACDDNEVDCNSVVMRVDYHEQSFLLSGDIREDVEEELADKYSFDTVEVIKAAHHASASGNSDALYGWDEDIYSEGEPALRSVVVSSSEDSNVPSREVFVSLEEHDVSTYWTAEHGDIEYVVRKDGDGDDEWELNGPTVGVDDAMELWEKVK